MWRLSGGCHCGNVLAEVGLTKPPATYNPRVCDCDFCRKHGTAYISDPAGSLRLHVNDEQYTIRYRHGLAIAEFLLCSHCGVVLGAMLRGDSGQLHGVCNARVLEGWSQFGSEQGVSPKSLSASERVRRWQSLWFSELSLVIGDG